MRKAVCKTYSVRLPTTLARLIHQDAKPERRTIGEQVAVVLLQVYSKQLERSMKPTNTHNCQWVDPETGKKRCSLCWEMKPLEDFHRARTTSGRTAPCIKCYRDRYETPGRKH